MKNYNPNKPVITLHRNGSAVIRHTLRAGDSYKLTHNLTVEAELTDTERAAWSAEARRLIAAGADPENFNLHLPHAKWIEIAAGTTITITSGRCLRGGRALVRLNTSAIDRAYTRTYHRDWSIGDDWMDQTAAVQTGFAPRGYLLRALFHDAAYDAAWSEARQEAQAAAAAERERIRQEAQAAAAIIAEKQDAQRRRWSLPNAKSY